MKITALFFPLFFILISVSAQDTAKVVDRVFTSDHKVYTGQITDDRKGDSLVISVYESGSYTIDYTLITKIQYRIDNPNYVEPKVQSMPPSKAMRVSTVDTNNMDLIAFNGYRATPRVTDKLVKKRNIGIGLTVGGVCMIGLGALIYAVVPRQTTTTSGGYQTTTPSAGSIAGILLMVGGVGVAIPGAALWGGYSRRLHKAEMEN